MRSSSSMGREGRNSHRGWGKGIGAPIVSRREDRRTGLPEGPPGLVPGGRRGAGLRGCESMEDRRTKVRERMWPSVVAKDSCPFALWNPYSGLDLFTVSQLLRGGYWI